MSELNISLEPSSSEDVVTMSSLVDPPHRRLPSDPMDFLISCRAIPGSTVPDWEVKNLEADKDGYQYVPMGSAARITVDEPNFLGTAHLNGCTAVAALYRDTNPQFSMIKETHVLLGHYDPESVRETNEHGQLKISEMIARFAGEKAVKVIVAYSKEHDVEPILGTYNAEDHPIRALTDDLTQLPAGSNVLFIPYATSYDLENPTTGHILYAGLGGSYLPSFGWNGKFVDFGKRERWGETEKMLARAAASDYENEDWLYE